MKGVGLGGRIILKMDLKEVELGGMDWIYLRQDRNRTRIVVNVAINRRVP